MADSKRRISIAKPKRVQTALNGSRQGTKKNINQPNSNNSRLKMNKTSVGSKNKLPGIKNVQPQNRMANTLLGKVNSVSKPALEEFEKEMADPSQVAIKEMVEQASVEQRAISMIEDTLYLFNNNGEGKGAGIEKYELINKEEFENMKNDIEKYRQNAMDLKEEYHKKKEEYEKVTNELNNHNYKYYNTEKAKTDSITKLYSLELKLKQIIVNNSKLQNEIQKEIEEKNNIFRALNEFKRKYEKNIHPELKEIFSKIKDEQYNPVNGIPKSDKIGFLEDKLESLKKELETKENRIQMLKKTIEENNANN